MASKHRYRIGIDPIIEHLNIFSMDPSDFKNLFTTKHPTTDLFPVQGLWFPLEEPEHVKIYYYFDPKPDGSFEAEAELFF